MALIRLAQADPAIAVLVRTESAESPEAKKAWSVVWDRLSPVTTVVGAMVLAIGMMPATGQAKPLDIQGLMGPDFAYSVYYVQILAEDKLFFSPIVFLQLPLERHIRWRSCSRRLIV
ncbi:DUF3693 domain-containing protein [Xanthomonas fragariae]|uniref:DUF3693 domain-containing protein n=1 Tax=Xanthomonas fragariae TaxID=48664 RepID=UPI001EDCFFF5|nr:DUF3693 domain-containing protein [Xanthomonas fragariae]